MRPPAIFSEAKQFFPREFWILLGSIAALAARRKTKNTAKHGKCDERFTRDA
jgi:hypothetical protein